MNTDMTNTGTDIQSLQQNTPTNAEEIQNKSNSLIERIEIVDTPFWLIIKDDERFITFGQYRISPCLNEGKDPKEWLSDHLWEVVTIMSSITFELHDKEKEYLKTHNDILNTIDVPKDDPAVTNLPGQAAPK